jgi:hypothetical protein
MNGISNDFVLSMPGIIREDDRRERRLLGILPAKASLSTEQSVFKVGDAFVQLSAFRCRISLSTQHRFAFVDRDRFADVCVRHFGERKSIPVQWV